MPRLFEESKIKEMTLRNRLVRSATWEGMCDLDGRPTERLVDCYRDLALGGVGLIISGYTFVLPEGRQLPGQMGIHDDSFESDYLKLTDAVHDAL
ncbi:MAG: NADH:flavin oxidoreductase, partial [bacterium]|nr:NADH:flavin oxidoreductase [bacterium]